MIIYIDEVGNENQPHLHNEKTSINDYYIAKTEY